ncbi:thioesterase II family protein [Streptomyces collinus]|uniref:thioesterase II family protein n=1 Tax=Streptomyces collinus TaxID=42684 RepID=UPI0036547AD1
MTEKLEGSPWIRRFHESVPGAPRLVCFPFAGGSASYFYELSQRLRAVAAVLAVQYPGRHDRMGEACVESVPELAAGVAEALAASADDRPVVFFGHSMGALVAFETAIALSGGDSAPRALLVSASRGPSVPARRDENFGTDAEIMADLRELNGTSEQLLANEALMQVVLPVVRADYRAVARYRSSPEARVSCPVTALTGDDDPLVDQSEARVWERHTTGGFRLRQFPGGHFFLDENRDRLSEELALLTASAAAPGH